MSINFRDFSGVMIGAPVIDGVFQWRTDHLIGLRHAVAVLASPVPWRRIQAPVARQFAQGTNGQIPGHLGLDAQG
ncbi:hypothetical protein [Ottowia thiooxydans]|uniref:hypothetical protein n=1 Tax=Ottowia thiooxydans TaxID=219182 RepID=UPI00048FDE7E|nr:hypothetical protein [Ottowia thiooxydans]